MAEKIVKRKPGNSDLTEDDVVRLKADWLQWFAIYRCNISMTADKIGIHRRSIDRWRLADEDFNSACLEVESKVRDAMEQKLVDLTDLCEHEDAKQKQIGLRALDRWLCARHPEYRQYGRMADFSNKNTTIQNAIIMVNDSDRQILSEVAKEACKKGMLGVTLESSKLT